MAEDKPQEDWVQPMNFKIDPKIPLEKLEKPVNLGRKLAIFTIS